MKNSQDKVLNFLYNNFFGRLVLFILSRRFISKISGYFMNSRFSKFLIKRTVENYNIDMDEYVKQDFFCYNDFFTRKIIPEKRLFDNDKTVLCSPCDSKLTVYEITEKSVFQIKNSYYSVSSFLGGNLELSEQFNGGLCLIFRLCVDNYHRYHFFDDGKIGKTVFIKGKLHTVNPIALERINIYAENCREYTVLHTENFGLAVQAEVGAMLVGKIENHKNIDKFKRGEEKGMFLFGGSTVVLLLKKGTVEINSDILENSGKNIETDVLTGQKIGKGLII